jgi:hypothetical protein
MPNTVFVLGAGASAASGVPTMNTFLDKAEGILRGGKIGADAKAFELAFRAIAELQTVFAKATIDTDNLEAVFVAFEMAGLLGKLGSMGEADIRDLPGAMRRLIVRTIEESMSFPIDKSTGMVRAPEGYGAFAEYCSAHVDEIAIITFNYDYGLDYALANAGLPLNYCLDTHHSHAGLRLLKLHGSLLWEESGLGKIVPRPVPRVIASGAFSGIAISADKTRICLTAGSSADGLDKPEFHSAIVPPTWDKAKHRTSIENVWRTASACLGEADNIVVSGFSLPPTDDFFKFLYALGSAGNRRLKAFWVCEASPTMELAQRFQSLLGPTARVRYKLAPMTFSDMANALRAGDFSRLESRMGQLTREYVKMRAQRLALVEEDQRPRQDMTSMYLMMGLL